jgi:hypothetical protein
VAVMNSENRSRLMAKFLLGLEPKVLVRCCMKCSSIENIEWHHICGRNHDHEFLAGERGHVVPLCRTCHRGRWGIHSALAQAKVDLRFTPDEVERQLRAWKAILVFLWWQDEHLEKDK